MPVISIILFATAVVVLVFTQGARNTRSPAALDQGRTAGIPNEYAS